MLIDFPFHFYAHVRNQFLFGDLEGHGEFTNAIVMACDSTPARAITYTVLLETGAIYTGLPIVALASSVLAPLRPIEALEYYDACGHSAKVTQLQALRDLRASVIGSPDWGRYIHTIHWIDDGYSREPAQHTFLHLLELHDGNYGIYPNQKLLWIMKDFTKYTPTPGYKRNTSKYFSEI